MRLIQDKTNDALSQEIPFKNLFQTRTAVVSLIRPFEKLLHRAKNFYGFKKLYLALTHKLSLFPDSPWLMPLFTMISLCLSPSPSQAHPQSHSRSHLNVLSPNPPRTFEQRRHKSFIAELKPSVHTFVIWR